MKKNKSILDTLLDESKDGKLKWETKRKKIFGFRFYRKPLFLGLAMFHIFDKPKPKVKKYQVTWEEWERKIQKLCPIQYFLREKVWAFFTMDICKGLYSFYFDNIYRRFKPCNVLKINTLTRHYTDESNLLLHASFQIFDNFMQRITRPDHHVNWNEKSQKAFMKKALKLWDWWKNWKQTSYEMEKKAMNSGNLKAFIKHEEYVRKTEDKKLVELISIRHHLWD